MPAVLNERRFKGEERQKPNLSRALRPLQGKKLEQLLSQMPGTHLSYLLGRFGG
jgi:hypothetical protein